MPLSGIELSAGIVVTGNKPADAKYGPYATTAAALADIGSTLRYKGLTVGIEGLGGIIVEYWFADGIADANLVPKAPLPPTANFGGTNGSTPGTAGLVPLPTATDYQKYLKGDGTWANVPQNVTRAEVGLRAPLYYEVTIAGATPAFLNGTLRCLNVETDQTGFTRPNYEATRSTGELVILYYEDDVYRLRSFINGNTTFHAGSLSAGVPSPVDLTDWQKWDGSGPFAMTVTGVVFTMPTADQIGAERAWVNETHFHNGSFDRVLPARRKTKWSVTFLVSSPSPTPLDLYLPNSGVQTGDLIDLRFTAPTGRAVNVWFPATPGPSPTPIVVAGGTSYSFIGEATSFSFIVWTAINPDWNSTSGLTQILNKPTIPAAQVSSDWNATTGVAQILNKPTIPAAQVSSDWNATTGVAQILNKPEVVLTSDARLTDSRTPLAHIHRWEDLRDNNGAALKWTFPVTMNLPFFLNDTFGAFNDIVPICLTRDILTQGFVPTGSIPTTQLRLSLSVLQEYGGATNYKFYIATNNGLGTGDYPLSGGLTSTHTPLPGVGGNNVGLVTTASIAFTVESPFINIGIKGQRGSGQTKITQILLHVEKA